MLTSWQAHSSPGIPQPAEWQKACNCGLRPWPVHLLLLLLNTNGAQVTLSMVRANAGPADSNAPTAKRQKHQPGTGGSQVAVAQASDSLCSSALRSLSLLACSNLIVRFEQRAPQPDCPVMPNICCYPLRSPWF